MLLKLILMLVNQSLVFLFDGSILKKILPALRAGRSLSKQFFSIYILSYFHKRDPGYFTKCVRTHKVRLAQREKFNDFSLFSSVKIAQNRKKFRAARGLISPRGTPHPRIWPWWWHETQGGGDDFF